MFKSDLDFEESYCLDDFEFNYIFGLYVIEVIEDEEVNVNKVVVLLIDDILDLDMFKFYEDELIVSEEWVFEYEKR